MNEPWKKQLKKKEEMTSDFSNNIKTISGAKNLFPEVLRTHLFLVKQTVIKRSCKSKLTKSFHQNTSNRFV